MSAYADAAASASGGTPADGPGYVRRCSCHVVGCAQAGVLSDSTGGTDRWFCRVHFGAPASDWQRLTAMVANRAQLFQAAHMLCGESAGAGVPPDVARQLRAHNRPEVTALLAGNKPARTVGAQLLGLLERECRQPQTQTEFPTTTAGRGQHAAAADFDHFNEPEHAWS